MGPLDPHSRGRIHFGTGSGSLGSPIVGRCLIRSIFEIGLRTRGSPIVGSIIPGPILLSLLLVALCGQMTGAALSEHHSCAIV